MGAGLRVGLLGWAFSVAQPAPAFANGRFPKAQVVLPVPGDADTLALRATVGILLSQDGGRSFRWLCEQALGFEGVYDPPLTLGRGGRIVLGLTDGLRTASFDGCTVAHLDDLRGEQVSDLTTGPGGRVFAITSTQGKSATLYAEGGARFERLASVPAFVFDTVEVAPSRPQRVYVTGYPTEAGAEGEAHFFRSDDGGRTLRETRPTLAAKGRLFVSAVHPQKPDWVLVRQLRYDGSAVLLSRDGGKSFEPVLTLKGALLGFAMAPDGQRVFAGSGDPAEGLYRSRDGGLTWENVQRLPVHCLAATASTLFVCSMPFGPGSFLLASSPDDGATVQPLSTFASVKGAVPCTEGAAAICAGRWSEVATLLEGTSARYGDASASDDPPSEGAADAADAAEVSRPASRCRCDVVGAPAPSGAFAMFVALVALALRRRREALDPSATTGEPACPQRVRRRGGFVARFRALRGGLFRRR